jgi:hypothetical protein
MKIVKLISDPLDIGKISSIVKLCTNNYTLTELEEDITNNEEVMESLLVDGNINYLQYREAWKYVALTFSAQTPNIKSKICKHCAIDIPTIIGYYISLGMSEQEATYTFAQNKIDDITTAATACFQLLECRELKELFFLTMPASEVTRLFRKLDIEALLIPYMKLAMFGKYMGDSEIGIIDFMTDNAEYLGTGFSTHTVNDENYRQYIIDRFIDIIVYGNIKPLINA